MLIKIVIPVVDTESGNFDYNGNLSTEDYEDMVMDNFYRTNNQMNRFVDNISRGVSNVPTRKFGEDITDRNNPDIKFNYCETDAVITSSKDMEIDESFFIGNSDGKHMAMFALNINPNMEPDAASEIKFWMNDSRMVLEDPDIDDKTKIMTLPKRNFAFKINENEYSVNGCKILKILSNGKYPLKFIIISEQILKN